MQSVFDRDRNLQWHASNDPSFDCELYRRLEIEDLAVRALLRW